MYTHTNKKDNMLFDKCQPNKYEDWENSTCEKRLYAKASALRNKVPVSISEFSLALKTILTIFAQALSSTHTHTSPYISANKDWQWRIGESNRWKTHLLPIQIHNTFSRRIAFAHTCIYHLPFTICLYFYFYVSVCLCVQGTPYNVHTESISHVTRQ